MSVSAWLGLPRDSASNGKEIEPGGIGAAVAPRDLDVDDVRTSGRRSLEAALQRRAQPGGILDALGFHPVRLADRGVIDGWMIERAPRIAAGRGGASAVLM